MVHTYDVKGYREEIPIGNHIVYLLGCPDSHYLDWPFKPGDVVIDPWDFFVKLPDDIKLIKVGKSRGQDGDRKVDDLIWSRHDM